MQTMTSILEERERLGSRHMLNQDFLWLSSSYAYLDTTLMHSTLEVGSLPKRFKTPRLIRLMTQAISCLASSVSFSESFLLDQLLQILRLSQKAELLENQLMKLSIDNLRYFLMTPRHKPLVKSRVELSLRMLHSSIQLDQNKRFSISSQLHSKKEKLLLSWVPQVQENLPSFN